MERTAAINTGPSTHLDHLAPLCELLEIPLIVTELEHLELAKTFYPMIDTRYVSLAELSLEYMATQFDAIVECGKFWGVALKPVLKLLFNKDLRVIFSPHGQSDKESFIGETVAQDIDLAYGPLMLQEKTGKNVVPTGNVRLWFYEKHKAHFDSLAETSVFSHFDPEKETILYAPTWSSKATGTSFFEETDRIVARYADNYNLLIKLHPLLEENHPAHFHRIVETHKEKALFLLDFPPVYPLLEKTDIYLGDYSSIGYDFLKYNRPLYFLKEGGRLQKCGELHEKNLSSKQINLSTMRKELYEQAFGGNFDGKMVGKKIKALLEK